ncbi:uncharacterized protein LOC133204836 [Saccostrea echinata]|uniref:uncharacterized protein LOC133204836 n=1 Tax=Saccostrea echinata TaxID=191078 RepID=UPI002A83805A|nr:uncharacterized protein LOC133204836 [Saccostrea echinata]
MCKATRDFGVSQTSTIYGSPVDTCTRRDVQALKSLSIYLAENALTVSTRNSYDRAKLTCNEFLSKYFPGAPMFPMTNEQLVLFISYCYQKELSPQTVTTYMSALAHFHKMEGYPDPTQNFILKRTIQGFSKLKARPDTRLPITPIILQRIINSLPKCTQSFYQRTLFKAMFLLAFHAFLRVGEITSPTKNTLNLSAVSFEKQQNGVPECMTLTMVDFKHHRGKPPVTFHLNANKDKPELCAVLAMWEYKELRGGSDGPLFMFQDKSPVSSHYFNQQLKISLNYLNYDTKLYKGHSFRLVQLR